MSGGHSFWEPVGTLLILFAFVFAYVIRDIWREHRTRIRLERRTLDALRRTIEQRRAS